MINENSMVLSSHLVKLFWELQQNNQNQFRENLVYRTHTSHFQSIIRQYFLRL